MKFTWCTGALSQEHCRSIKGNLNITAYKDISDDFVLFNFVTTNNKVPHMGVILLYPQAFGHIFYLGYFRGRPGKMSRNYLEHSRKVSVWPSVLLSIHFYDFSLWVFGKDGSILLAISPILFHKSLSLFSMILSLFSLMILQGITLLPKL